MDLVQQDKLQATKVGGHASSEQALVVRCLLARSFSFLASVPLRLHATSAARCCAALGGLDARVCQGVLL